MLRISTLLLCLLGAPAHAEPLIFLAFADVRDRHGYETFLTAVAPIWARHGMSLHTRLQLDEADGFDDLAIIRVEDRAGFRRYLADQDYRAIASRRLDALDALTIVEGPARPLATPLKAGAPASLIVQSSCGGDEPGASVALIAPVKGDAPSFLAGAGCIRILSADDAPTGAVTAGFAATVRP